ncbi:MarR family winged helix-turn-helix transcriptional regulator [Lapillicoccus jejuensis]|uniref:DNA-binding MarR family transcriptional regulator n=1 Tax=Lapillicoccus jejuensis TaxID=402171 RepID=A0A542E0Z4_9MICO|nr:MarR family winged helix-turn-helix transcriptional regulator [Lapillicoccus jejuensis]TQJ09007.1 DNA-binding MarR family transcriptional regulator [Lapillicoccus jejuensis]
MLEESDPLAGADLLRSVQLLVIAVGHYRSVVADDLGLPANDSQALQVLDVLGPMPQMDLGRRLRLTSSSMTALVDRLETAGYAERRPDPGDRRRSIVVLTPRADRALEAARTTMEQHLAADLVADEDLARDLRRLAADVGGIESIDA